jgi:hypothetical protein
MKNNNNCYNNNVLNLQINKYLKEISKIDKMKYKHNNNIMNLNNNLKDQ